MLIVYYTDKTGKIVNCHDGKGATLQELNALTDKYNQASKNGKAAHAVEAEDGSLTAYLFNKATEQKKWDEDTVREAITDIQNALDAVQGLLS